MTRLITIAALVWVLGGCAEQQPPEKNVVRPVKAMKIADAGQLRQRSFPGRAKATQHVDLAFRVGGPLIERPVDVGDTVKQGDVLARIDPRDFEVNLRNTQGQLDNAKATLRRTESEYQRELNILKQDPGATSEAAVDRARQQRDSARASIKSLEAAIANAEDELSYTYLKAPFEGTVVTTYVENFQNVRAKESIVRVVDDSRIEMTINIPESLISHVRSVKKGYVAFDAFPGRELEATVKEIGTEASETTRTYPVTLIMDQPDDIKILPGMAGKTTRADIDSPDVAGLKRISIPVAATFASEEPDKTYVWVIDEEAKTVSRREVTTGELRVTGITINSGLKPEEWIVMAGVHYLRDGQQVRMLEEKTK